MSIAPSMSPTATHYGRGVRRLWQRVVRHFTLLRTFGILSAIILAIIADLLGATVQFQVEQIALSQEAASVTGHSQELVQMTTTTSGPSTLSSTTATGSTALSARQKTGSAASLQGPVMASLTKLAMDDPSTLAATIWSTNGTVAYTSDWPSPGNASFTSTQGLQQTTQAFSKTPTVPARLGSVLAAMMAGKLQSIADMSSLDFSDRLMLHGSFPQQMTIYVPIRDARTHAIIGGFEVQHNLASLNKELGGLRHTIWFCVLCGFLFLFVALFMIVRNASLRLVRQSKELAHQAYHDSLTGLPNRTLLHAQLHDALELAARKHQQLALLLMDLDHFKELNDTFGHHHGDGVLCQVGQRLSIPLRPGDMLARLGGDEFALVLPNTDESTAVSIAAMLLQALEQSFLVAGHRVTLGISIGIALAPEHGQDGDDLLRRADVAMYTAKRAACGTLVYTPEQDQNTAEQVVLLGELRTAIEEDQLVLHYQPKVDLSTGQLDGVETLVRWQHPQRGLLPPDQFIPLAERSGLIGPLSHWVLSAALQQCRNWLHEGLEIRIAVNLSARLLHEDTLIQTVAALLDQQSVPAALLELEITESAVMIDPGRALDALVELREMGIIISIDDFGTGYSSLAYLKKLPVDQIKIDKSFVREMTRRSDDAIIARSIVDLGHNLGLRVVAEGVETLDTYSELARMGCDQAQGYFLSRPIPAADLAAWVRILASAQEHQTAKAS